MTRQQRKAAEWAVTMRGDPGASDRKAFEAWYAKPGNAEAYAQAEDDWAYTSGLSPERIREASLGIRGEAGSSGGFRWALATIAIAVLALGGLWHVQRGGEEPQIAQHRSAATEQMLSDGTRVTLMDGAHIETRFGAGRRILTLTGGRARFEVAHDAARPFTVIAGRSETTALGTVFEIDARQATPRVKLIEGSVVVRSSAGGGALRLAPGESAEVTETGPRRVPAMANPAPAAAPASLLIADHLPLGAVLDRANKTGAKPIRLADPTLASLRVTGSFDVAAGAALARKLAAALDLGIDERASDTILRQK